MLSQTFVIFSPTIECFGVSIHIAFGVIPGTAGPSAFVRQIPETKVPVTRIPGTRKTPQVSGNQGFGNRGLRGVPGTGYRELGRVPGIQYPGFREPSAGRRGAKVLGNLVTYKYPGFWKSRISRKGFGNPSYGKQGSGIPRL